MGTKRVATGEPKRAVPARRKLPDGFERKVEPRSARVKRGKQNDVDRILDAASKLLASKGLGAFNMNAVAALAEVDLPTLHTHFKDKTEVLLALYEKTMAERTSAILGMIQQLQLGSEAETLSWFYKQIETLVDMQLENPAHVALRRAIRAVPELSDADEKTNADFTVAIANALRMLLPKLGARRSQVVARTVVEAGTVLVEHCALHPKEARDISREIGMMIVGYVREVIRTAV